MAVSLRTSPFGFSTGSLVDVKSKAKDLPLIHDHYFNHALTVILPGVNMIPQGIPELLTEQLTYKVRQLPLHKLIERPFIQAFVKKGAVHILSLNTKLDTHDCVVVTPTGWLILHLTKDTYEELGLEAVKQMHKEKGSNIYVVKINLLADHFHPGKKGYERTLWCLKDRLNLKFDFLVSWEPHDEKVCSSSIGVYFLGKCESVERLDLETTTRICTSLPCPKIDAENPEGSESGCHFHEVFEWMGAMACGLDLTADDAGPGSYTSTFTSPEPSYNCPRCCVFQVSGMITPQSVERVWNALRDHTSGHPESLPASITVHGFADCPVVYKTVSHNFYVSGDNLYSFVLLSNNRYWSYTASIS